MAGGIGYQQGITMYRRGFLAGLGAVMSAPVLACAVPAFAAKENAVLFVDAARFGDDFSVVTLRRGGTSTVLLRLKRIYVSDLSRAAMQCMDAEGAECAYVNMAGVGCGVAD